MIRSRYLIALVSLGVVSLIGSTSGRASAQDEPTTDVVFTPVQVTPSIYSLEGDGGNIGLFFGDDTAFLIDDQFAPLTDRLLAEIKKLTPKPVDFVVNTHWHGDHTGGNENLRGQGATIFAHANVRLRMTQRIENEIFGHVSEPAAPRALPIVTFTDSITFHINGDTVDVVSVPPAHTDGDSFIHFRKANVIHCGDLFWPETYPFIDLGAGGSLEGSISACDTLLARSNDETLFIPGHGKPGTRADLIAYQTMLRTARDKVRAAMANAKDVGEVIVAKPLAELDDPWGKGFLPTDVFVQIVCFSLDNETRAGR